MTPPVRDLSIETFPLIGSQLIEASAGTGKTWTIAMLYLRLVLGPHDGGVQAITRPLHPREILVVTFTEAATQELKDRIRQRLADAATVFRDGARAPHDWPEPLRPVAALRALYAPLHWPALAQRLQLAADAMDDAAIATLHGWCHRILREQAFASGSPFTLTLVPDIAEVVDEAVTDLWRLQYRPLSDAQAASISPTWATPEALADAVRPLLPHAAHWDATEPALADATVADLLTQALAQRRAALAALKAPWPERVHAARTVLEAHGLLKALGAPHAVRKWLTALADWGSDPDDATPPRLGEGWKRFHPDWLRAHFGDAPPPPDVAGLALWEGIPALQGALQTLPSPLGRLLRHAAVWVQRRVTARLAERDQLGFDGLLTRLAQALDGPAGPALAARVRARFPAALVDEFQDTDPVQLRILDRIYALAQPAPQTALILIGDPKQAIYAFRQADIHSYLQARRACAGRLWRLDTNHRSSQAMVDAVNHLFQRADAARPEGAFRFRTNTDDPVPFVPVRARGRPERWCTGPGGPARPALVVAHLPRPDQRAWTKERLRSALAGACADAVAQWLQEGAEGTAGFGVPPDGPGPAHWRPVRPADIAILVNDRFEAAALQQALRERGVASVYLSDRESVYASPQADDLARWLLACAHPRDGAAIRAALATDSLGQSPAELEAWTRDDGRWEILLDRFAHYHSLWQRHGVLPAVRALLHDFQVPERLLSAGSAAHGGERALTNLLHLAELLQHAAAPTPGAAHGMTSVLRHLQRSRERARRGVPPDGGDSATPQLRLDSERDRVQLVTVHKSKGLEYPLVCYPFAMHAKVNTERGRGGAVQALTWHDDDGWLQVTLSDEGERWSLAVARAEEERRAEDVRRLYVALTRARHATWIGLAATETLPLSALGHLLGIDGMPAEDVDAHLAAAARAVAAGCTAIAVQTLAPGAPPRHVTAAAREGEPPPRVARIAPSVSRPRWWIASYSALLAPDPAPDAGLAPLLPDAPASARDEQFGETRRPADATDRTGDPPPPVVAPPRAAWHRWPRGPVAGTALHALLEGCARHGFARAADTPDWLHAHARAILSRQGWDAERLSADACDLAEWARAILDAPLPLPAGGTASVALRDLGAVQPEMEFWLGATGLDTATLDAWVRTHVPGDTDRPALRPAALHGMLKGFIDLVFEHGGRYYVLDHKSNWLGADDGDYHGTALHAAVLAHRYELQGVLYLVALHRLLGQRLAGYRPERHLGGALCVFWRGVRGPARGVYRLPAPVALIERLDAALSGRPAEMAI